MSKSKGTSYGEKLSSLFYKKKSRTIFECCLCHKDKIQTGTGFSNLKSHIEKKHSDAFIAFEESLKGN